MSTKSSEIRDLFRRSNKNKENISNNEQMINDLNKSRIKVPSNLKQIRCAECKEIHVFLNQTEVSCCNTTYFKE